jgi:dipeptidyl aminopeptidase/acylaminoacyl peptidase
MLGQAPTSWTTGLAMQVQSVGSPRPSADGKWVVYTQTRQVMETEKSESNSQVWLARADGSHRVQLTRGDKSSSNPSFSPDGRWVYFTSSRSGKNQVWRIPVDGGEAEAVTDLKDDAGGYALSPDGKQVAFTAHEAGPDEEKAKKEKRDFHVIDEKPRNHALYVIPAEVGASGKRAQRKIASGDYHVGSAFGAIDLAWSPDSRSIAFTHTKRPEADYWTTSDISEVDVESGVVKPLAATSAAESGPAYSPDGRWIAYQRTSHPPRWPFDNRIVLMPRSGGASRELPATFDEQAIIIGWDADSRRVLFSETRHTKVTIYGMPLDGPPAVFYTPPAGTAGAVNLNDKGTHVAFTVSSPSEAVEAFTMSVSGSTPVRVSRANVDLPKLAFPKTEVVKWKSKDGLDIEGILTYPVDYQAGKKYPLLLNIHGGPAGVFSEAYIGGPGIYPLATLAAKGYAILRPNPRGSSGYGKKFRFANENDWGGGDYRDLMAGVDHLIATGVADPDHMGVMGWSYGGFMTSWVITQTTRFKAAVVGAGVTNLWSFTGTADIPGFLPDYFKGEPWDAFENYRAHSPMAHVKNVKTPSLILHGESDVRVPISQGFELYNAIKRQGVTAKMVTYPRMPHGPNEPKFMLDIMNRHIDWMDKYVR